MPFIKFLSMADIMGHLYHSNPISNKNLGHLRNYYKIGKSNDRIKADTEFQADAQLLYTKGSKKTAMIRATKK